MWGDFFTGTPEVVSSYSTTPISISTYCMVVYCFFSSLSNRAIFVSSSSMYNVLVEQCVFSKINHQGINGGAIYFSCTNQGGFVLKGSCGYETSAGANSNGIFLFSATSSSGINKVLFSTVAYSIDPTINCLGPIWLDYGKQNCQNVNVSYCLAYKITGIAFKNSNNGVSSFLTVVHTYTPFWNVLWFAFSGTTTIEDSNIVNNTQNDLSYGLMHSYSAAGICKRFIFVNNSLFYFSINGGGSGSLLDSYFDIAPNQNNGVLISNILPIRPTYCIEHIITAMCEGNIINTLYKTKFSSKLLLVLNILGIEP